MAISQSLVQYFLTKNLVKLNTSGKLVDADTVLKDALSSATLGEVSNQILYRILTRREIALNGGDGDQKWPAGWLSETPKTLAPQLV